MKRLNIFSDLETIKKHIITIALSLLVVCWTFVKDAFVTGADAKFKQSVIVIVKGEDATRYYNTLIREAIDNEMNNPMSLIEILSSEHVNRFAQKKAAEVREAVRKELLKEDSIKGNLIHDLGLGTGIRNDEVLDELTKLLKAFREGKLYSSRTVRANF